MAKNTPATDASRAPRVSFVSLGCPKALVDSERIITRLRAEGYELTREHDGADLVIVNTCGFLDSAQAESLDAIGDGAGRERQGHRHRLHGRRAGEDHRALSRTCSRSPARSNTRACSTPCIARRRRSTIRSSIWCRREGIKLTPRHYAYLKISEGCNNRCTLLHHPEAARRSGLAPGRRRAARGRAAGRGRRQGTAGHLAGHLGLRRRHQIRGEPVEGPRGAREVHRSRRARSASSASGCGCTTSIPIRMSTRSSR